MLKTHLIQVRSCSEIYEFQLYANKVDCLLSKQENSKATFGERTEYQQSKLVRRDSFNEISVEKRCGIQPTAYITWLRFKCEELSK